MARLLSTRVVCDNGPQSMGFYFGESLHPDGTVLNQCGGIMRANFTCAGTGTWKPTRQCFRTMAFDSCS